MERPFDIILHGKSNSGCHLATDGLDDQLCQNLVNNFFESSKDIKESEILIVDTKYWKDKWYSVYSFWVGDIRDTASRDSSFAISIVIPDQYLFLVSTVYDLLRGVYNEYVIGNYIVNGKYKVADFSNKETFNQLCDLIYSKFVNVNEKMGEDFKCNNDKAPHIFYSLLDCDSRAFVEDLKKFGRIFVSEKYESKDQRLAEAGEYRNKFEQAEGALGDEKSKNNKLLNEIRGLRQNVETEMSNANSNIASIKHELEIAESNNSKLEEKIKKLNNEKEEYENIKKEIRKLLGTEEKAQTNQTCKNKTTAAPNVSVTGVISIVNTLLLIILFMAFCVKSCVSGTDYNAYTKSVEKLEQKLDGLINAQKADKQMEEFQYSADDENNTDNTYSDIDCGLVFWQNSKPVNPDEIDINLPLMIKVTKTVKGYSFYTSNLKVEKIESGKEFKLTRKDNKKPIKIYYGSADTKNVNKANVVIIKQKEK